MRKREIIVLQGPPACGKSTYARELHKKNQNYVIVSRDNIREARGDRRPDFEVKREIYKEKIEPWCDVAAVFEDRDQCVDMWREEGLLCLQPARGNF